MVKNTVILFSVFPKIFKDRHNHVSEPSENNFNISADSVNKEVSAAIAMALALYLDNQHDEESLVLTMNLSDRLNTQWNNKIQNIIQ